MNGGLALRTVFVVMSVFATIGSGCVETGVQGGDLQSVFPGVDRIYAVSPTAVRLEWSAMKRFEKYKIYQEGINAAIKEEIFTYSIITNLAPVTTYRFSAAGVDSAEKEEGVGNFAAVTTLPNFTGILAQNLVVRSPTRIDLTWSIPSSVVSYDIYMRKVNETWDLTKPTATVRGIGEYSANGLDDGTQYCFFLQARYDDGTAEPAALDLTSMNIQGPCLTTSSSLAGLPVISLDPVIPGAYPWFVAENGATTMAIEVFDSTTNVRVASRTGNGPFRAFVVQSGGKRKYYAVVSQVQADGSTKSAQVDVNTDNNNIVHLRNLDGVGASGKVFPRLISGGKGTQGLGSTVAKGDFNCDGLPDVAISAPDATPYVDEGHLTRQGAVVVFYTRLIPPFTAENPGSQPLYKLRTEIDPSPYAEAPNPQLIYYPVAQNAYRFGSKLTVGNFNGDCRRLGGTPVRGNCDDVYETTAATPALQADIRKIYSCDDLVVGANQGASGDVFVIYGDSSVGLVSGAGATNYGDNETTCDTFTGSCRASKYNYRGAATAILYFGRAMAVGDFNNDGFDDLAVSSQSTSTGSARGVVSVLRGSAEGVQPLVSGAQPINAFPYPFAEIDSINLSTIGADQYPVGSGTPEFGEALGVAYNSRTCSDQSNAGMWTRKMSLAPKQAHGFDFSKCDDLIVGDPGRDSSRGSIVSCQAAVDVQTTDPVARRQQIRGWSCIEHWPTSLGAGSRYGASILGIPNQNGYPIDVASQLDAGQVPDVRGALFVGAPEASVPYPNLGLVTTSRAGIVFGYYLTNAGGIQSYLDPNTSHPVNAVNGVACNQDNSSCVHQAIYLSAPQMGSGFGSVLGTIDDVSSFDRNRFLPFFVVGAPRQDVPGPLATTIVDAGAVYVFKPDMSALGMDGMTPVTSPKVTPTGKFLSGGVSPFGPSVIYPNSLEKSAAFGQGGVAGDQFNSTGSADLIVGAANLNQPVISNGGVFQFNSSGGVFGASQTTPDATFTHNVSKEVSYRFDMAKVVGDVNGDGYDEVMTRSVISSTRVELVLYYGSASGLVTSPTPALSPTGLGPRIIQAAGDRRMGIHFAPAGSVNGDPYDDVFLIGSEGSYIYYGSSSGLLSAVEPSISPVGKNPLKFAVEGSMAAPADPNDEYFVRFHGGRLQGADTLGSVTYDYSNQAMTHGDFNGDGYTDLAIGQTEDDTLPSNVDTSGLTIQSGSWGRVYVFYGGPSGLQVNGASGVIRRYLVSELGGGPQTEVDVRAKTPCSATNVCKVQMLASTNTSAKKFGFALAAVRLNPTSTMDSLVVSDPGDGVTAGQVFVYNPQSTGLDGAVVQILEVPNGHAAGGVPGGELYTYNPRDFGKTLAAAGDINGDGRGDLIVGAPNTIRPGVFAFYGGTISGQNVFLGETSVGAKNFFQSAGGAFPKLNGLLPKSGGITVLKPQYIRPTPFAALTGDPNQGNTALYGTAVAGVGDFNNDGFADIAVNIAKAEYNMDSVKPAVGSFLIFFGSQEGLRTDQPVSTIPRCYTEAETFCDPFQMFLPDSVDYENSYLSPTPAGDINGDGVPDLVVGGFGRNHPSGLAFFTGVFYVVY